MNMADSTYRGVRLGSMTKEELIDVVNEMGTELRQLRTKHIEELDNIRRLRR